MSLGTWCPPTWRAGHRCLRKWSRAWRSSVRPEEKASARLPTPDEKTALRIGASLAVISITRVATDAAGRLVEASLLVLPSDRADVLFTSRSMTEERTSTT
ncbi:UTRA domain-containing protein [Streptomyces virginiae]|uniref:UTRA domain-containing protein n=1 Tax=Streptomyces virginiae TaxID=1961 RepID=UPI00371DE7BC